MPLELALSVDEIVARYRAGETLAALAKACGCTQWTVTHRLRQLGEKLRRRGPKRQYALNEQFFETIDTEAKAYWLGFILADGRTSKTGAGNWVTRVDLGVVDRPHLVKLAAALETDAPIKPGHDGESAYIDLCSAVLCRCLVALECGPHKTGTHGTPLIPQRLQQHFYRGYHDGDGSVYPIPQNHAWRYDAVGSLRFIRTYQQWLMQRANVRKTKLVKQPPVASLRYTGGRQVERICRVLYKNATIYLERKYEAYQALKERHG